MTQQKLADLIGVNRSAISHYENNRITPAMPMAIKIARIFNSTVEELFGDVQESDSAVDVPAPATERA